MANSGFWQTVLKVELADIAFAVDSILAAVALAVTLPGIDAAKRIMIKPITPPAKITRN
jgi:predicted tellurium resistance membrane protein TerC